MLRRAINDVDALIELYEAVAELPRLDLSCQLRLPRLLTAELERLRSAIAADDGEGIQVALPDALVQVDNPLVRADLARAVLALREAGRVSEEVAAPRSSISIVMPMPWCARRSSPRLRWTVARTHTVGVGARRVVLLRGWPMAADLHAVVLAMS